jgi:glyoxylase-like metal-dependent hydrolase (beta-lactamase superfamily II)
VADTQIIDTKMHGGDDITAAFLIRGDDGTNSLIETGPKSSVRHVFAALDAAGIERLDRIVVTHIHLDHAGAAGTLVERFPEAVVYVHEIGAPHLADPAKLWASASRIYGDAMERMWGGIDPIPQSNIRVVSDGDEIDLGGRVIRAIETPGHAYHHHAYLDESTGTVFTGDAVGVRLPDVGVIRPATPPPEFHMEKAIASIERVRSLGATTAYLTHFGPHDRGERVSNLSELCDESIEALRRWAEWVRDARASTSDLDDATEIVRKHASEDMETRLPSEAIERMELTTSYRMNVSGYMRYFDKNEAAA